MRNNFNIATTRAVSNPSTVSEYILPMLKKEGFGVLYCGKWTNQESKNLDKTLEILEGKLKIKKRYYYQEIKAPEILFLFNQKIFVLKFTQEKLANLKKIHYEIIFLIIF